MARAASDREVEMAALVARLNHPERWLLEYWCRRRADQRPPPRQSIDPIDMPRLLPNLQIHLRSPTGRLHCRLSGTAIVHAMQTDATGLHLDETISTQAYEARRALFEQALTSGRPLLYRARMRFVGVDWRLYRRFMLPLRFQSDDSDMILSLVQFEQQAPGIEGLSPSDLDVLEHHEMGETELMLFAFLFASSSTPAPAPEWKACRCV